MRFCVKSCLAGFLWLLVVQLCQSLDNGLAVTPPMGWMSWERFRCNIDCTNDPHNCISEQLYMDMADRLVATGLRDAGYVYVMIDDCWSAKERDSKGRLQPDPDRFSSGIKYLADYMHQRGLKLGIYGDMGKSTCGGYPGSEFYMESDANTFAEWGIDSFKMDACYGDRKDFPIAFPIMGRMLNRTGRPIMFSCEWPISDPNSNFTHIAEVCNTWRVSHDMEESWDIVTQVMGYYAKLSSTLSNVTRPGAFNDLDVLILGNFALSYDQERAMIAMWAILASPFVMSNDLRSIRNESLALLLNRNLIALNQDKLGKAGYQILGGDQQIWARPISPVGSFAFAFLNLGINTGGAWKVDFTLPGNDTAYNVTDGFTGQYKGTFSSGQNISASANPSGVDLIIAKSVKKLYSSANSLRFTAEVV